MVSFFFSDLRQVLAKTKISSLNCAQQKPIYEQWIFREENCAVCALIKHQSCSSGECNATLSHSNKLSFQTALSFAVAKASKTVSTYDIASEGGKCNVLISSRTILPSSTKWNVGALFSNSTLMLSFLPQHFNAVSVCLKEITDGRLLEHHQQNVSLRKNKSTYVQIDRAPS